jgi:hypothetical protein
MEERDEQDARDERESVSGALRDAGGYERAQEGGPAEDPLSEEGDDTARGRDRKHGGWGDEGIAGGRAGGTGL